MTDAASSAPLRRSVKVAASPDQAFELFTKFGWWPKAYSILASKSPQSAVLLEPRAGGRWFERGEDGSEADWSKVIAIEKPSRLILTWQLGPDYLYHPELPTEVEMTFAADYPKGTTVTLEHRHFDRFGAEGEAMRASVAGPQGWEALLQGFAEAASG